MKKSEKSEETTSSGIQPVWWSPRFAAERVDYFRWFTEEESKILLFPRNFDLSDGKITGDQVLTKLFFRKFSAASGIIGNFYGEKAHISKMLRNWHNKKNIFGKHCAQRQRRQGSDPCLLAVSEMEWYASL